ncbi:DNA sulfur modification protein DndB [Photobacterium sp. TY1-4]|uniref:DNA sulfur modification protein DndB n=1 Tax=Photobacterium sp. TY1-4 TaxID=2899122 RepID=UPI0021C11530|nr:DNA sulfur modification protein DndB [Photobacterium sp. TY1-4]UXI00772.1 hypothetical protein NH461_13325 [Photobacterium sp. TY1-4]
MTYGYEPESALTLPLSGTCGSFRAGTKDNTVEVKYLLTHVSLDPNSSQDKALLKELAPFREIFDFKDLKFDELMQRDIDDSRVSHKLIPYILDSKNHAAVKFFPPIVVLLLPIEAESIKPAKYYDKVVTAKHPLKEVKGINKWHVLRSGEVGEEVFQFEQPILFNEDPDEHSFVKLRVNPQKSKLVIVDGQHRAMALLALHRNTQNGWDSKAKDAFQQYYEEWTPDIINSFDLSSVKLPIILCTIPDLDTEYQGDFDLQKAARSIFLTLNQTAQPVSNSRNLLLDDNDLISSFLRGFLAVIKQRDIQSDSSFRISNVELDQVENKVKLQSTTAFTGVQHLYYIIEHLLLDSGDVEGISARSGRFKSRKTDGYINGLKARLNSADVLGSDVDATIKRDSFSSEVEAVLLKQFEAIYGQYIRKILETFFPYSCHCDAVLKLRTCVEEGGDTTIKSIFFDGQGVAKVFEKHRDELNQKYADTPSKELQELLERVNNKSRAVENHAEDFKKIRFDNYVKPIQDKSKLYDEEKNFSAQVRDIILSIFDNTYTTIAFQSALVCSFFMALEQANDELDISGDLDVTEELDNYIANVNSFFSPDTFSRLKRVVSVLFGKMEGSDASSLKFIQSSSDSFRGVVCRSEMQPDLWPKYRYLFLEIWEPISASLKEHVNKEARDCRALVFEGLYNDSLKKYIKQHMKTAVEISHKERLKIFDECFKAHKEFLKNLTGNVGILDEDDLKKRVGL